jgi:hypothetical protein
MKARSGLAILLLLLAPAAFGAERAGVRMPDRVKVGDRDLVLNGMGVREATVFNVDVYVGGLYLEGRSSDGEAIAAATDQAKRLTLAFVRDVDRGDITKAWVDGFRKNGANMRALEARITRLNGWMTDFRKGETLVFTYEPGRGVTVAVKGQVKGIIEGEDFAASFFRIWLGPKPPNSGLKKGLLGR